MCASCPFHDTNFDEFNAFAERLYKKLGQPKPDFWACTSTRESVKADAIKEGQLACHCTVYDGDMNVNLANAKPCGGLAKFFQENPKRSVFEKLPK